MKYFRFILALTIGALLNLLFNSYLGGPIGFILIYAPKQISLWGALIITFISSAINVILTFSFVPIAVLLGIFEYLEYRQKNPKAKFEIKEYTQIKKVSGE